MKTIQYFIAAIFLTIVYSNAGNAQDIIHTQKIPLDSKSQNLKLMVNTFNGNIKITGTEKNEVEVEVYEMADHSDHSNSEHYQHVPNPHPHVTVHPDNYTPNIDTSGLKKIKTSTRDFEIVKEGNTIYVTAQNIVSRSGKSLGFNIKVPYKCSVTAHSSTIGNIEVEGIEGNLELNSVTGSIKASNIKGAVVSNAVTGITNVKITKTDNATPMVFSSVSGHIDVTLPSDIKSTFKMKTDYGEIFTDFDVKTKEVDKITSDDDPYRVAMNRWTVSDINGGGQEITFKTLNGNIYIRKK